MPPSDRSETAEGAEPRRVSVGGESLFVDASSSTAWAGDNREPRPPPKDDEPEASPLELAPAGDAPEIAVASQPADQTASGNTTVLARTVIPEGSGPAPVDAGVVYVGSRRTERLTMIVSTVLGTLGLLLAVGAAGLDQVRYDQPTPCATYTAAHHGGVAFGCTAAAKHLAVFLPAIGIPVLVLLALIAIWVPNWLPKARFGLLAGLLVLLVVSGVAVGVAYSALPKVA